VISLGFFDKNADQSLVESGELAPSKSFEVRPVGREGYNHHIRFVQYHW